MLGRARLRIVLKFASIFEQCHTHKQSVATGAAHEDQNYPVTVDDVARKGSEAIYF